MTILINQVAYDLPAQASLLDAIKAAGVTPPFAAAVNTQFVPRTAHASHVLKPNDQVELIVPITGG
ncbi:MAG: thiamine biosynthesis protein ThiS [Betaproteobacteria bacterium]|nr:thiamine biosynthesis protein ThiS [Betaproteobacteria bacterium]